MEHKIEVLGVTVDNYFVEEAMEIAEGFLKNDVLNIIGFVSANLLVAAAEKEQLKKDIENMDLSIIGEKEILEGTDSYDAHREEIDKNVFMKAFLMCMSDNKNSAFLIADNQKQAREFSEYLKENYPEIHIQGDYVLEGAAEDEDDIINEVNGISPDVVLSMISSEFQEKFVFKNRQKLNAKVWIGLGHHEKVRDAIGLKPSWLSKLVDKTLFKRMITKYNSDKGE